MWRKQGEKGLEESVTGRSASPESNLHLCLFMHIVHVQVCIILSCLTMLQGACSPWLVCSGLILRDCGAIYNDRSRCAVREASTVVAVGAYVNLTAVGAFQCSRMVIMSVLS